MFLIPRLVSSQQLFCIYHLQWFYDPLSGDDSQIPLSSHCFHSRSTPYSCHLSSHCMAPSLSSQVLTLFMTPLPSYPGFHHYRALTPLFSNVCKNISKKTIRTYYDFTPDIVIYMISLNQKQPASDISVNLNCFRVSKSILAS